MKLAVSSRVELVVEFLAFLSSAIKGMSDWRNWLERTSPVREVVSSNPGRDTCLVWNSGKFCNPSFLGGRIERPAGGHAVFRAILGINLLL